MDRLRRLRFKLLAYWRPRTLEADMAEEMRAHVERLAASNRGAGMSPDEADRDARKAFGNLAKARDQARDEQRLRWLDDLSQDIRYAARQLRRSPAFACSVTIVLALGIAAVTVVFSIVYGVLLRDLPYNQFDRLVTLGSSRRDTGFQGAYAGAADYFDWRAQQQVFEDLGLTRPVANFNLTRSGEPERLQGARATASVFSTLRAQPVVGRVFTEDEQLDPARASSVAVLGYRLWQRRFGAAPTRVRRSPGACRQGHRYPRVGAQAGILARARWAYPRLDALRRIDARTGHHAARRDRVGYVDVFAGVLSYGDRGSGCQLCSGMGGDTTRSEGGPAATVKTGV